MLVKVEKELCINVLATGSFEKSCSDIEKTKLLSLCLIFSEVNPGAMI